MADVYLSFGFNRSPVFGNGRGGLLERARANGMNGPSEAAARAEYNRETKGLPRNYPSEYLVDNGFVPSAGPGLAVEFSGRRYGGELDVAFNPPPPVYVVPPQPSYQGPVTPPQPLPPAAPLAVRPAAQGPEVAPDANRPPSSNAPATGTKPPEAAKPLAAGTATPPAAHSQTELNQQAQMYLEELGLNTGDKGKFDNHKIGQHAAADENIANRMDGVIGSKTTQAMHDAGFKDFDKTKPITQEMLNQLKAEVTEHIKHPTANPQAAGTTPPQGTAHATSASQPVANAPAGALAASTPPAQGTASAMPAAVKQDASIIERAALSYESDIAQGNDASRVQGVQNFAKALKGYMGNQATVTVPEGGLGVSFDARHLKFKPGTYTAAQLTDAMSEQFGAPPDITAAAKAAVVNTAGAAPAPATTPKAQDAIQASTATAADVKTTPVSNAAGSGVVRRPAISDMFKDSSFGDTETAAAPPAQAPVQQQQQVASNAAQYHESGQLPSQTVPNNKPQPVKGINV
jgi:hypothetical protein